jgi:hypothetical protein
MMLCPDFPRIYLTLSRTTGNQPGRAPKDQSILFGIKLGAKIITKSERLG